MNLHDDDGMTPGLKCDIELNVTGPNEATVYKWTAEALRKLADRIENDEFQSGHHDVADRVGKTIGTIYLDHYAGSEEL
ncbi:hypothetical protein [Hwanghaeella sp. 1Z406]|uniref:hypothetical protein n=1 Tax=Hwanghaeella sp. 1Z406 TaxID=3402811 RepID=UPI003B674B64